MDHYGPPNSSYNPNQIGFVFDQGTGAGPALPYPSSGPLAPAPEHMPFYPPAQQNFQPQSAPYPSPGYDHSGPGPGYQAEQHQMQPWYPEGHGSGPGAAPYQSYPYDHPEGAKYNDDINARGHGGGGGIPGGKLGVLGGAAAAGVGTALVTQLLLPKKLKKNKLVKYGLPIAGAGAGGYALNKMNNEKKWPPSMGGH